MTAEAIGAWRRRSFRDPQGRLEDAGQERLRRWVHPQALETLDAVSPALADARLAPYGRVIPWERAPAHGRSAEGWSAIEHQRMWCATLPGEWAPAQLFAAASLTLALQDTLLARGHRLKDATPFNVLFDGSTPVFVDVLSFEPLPSDVAPWPAYGQFVRSFLLPLLAQQRFGLGLRTTLGVDREGLSPEAMAAIAGPLGRWRPPLAGLVGLPLLLARLVGDRMPSLSVTRAELVLTTHQAVLRQLQRAVATTAPEVVSSAWTTYGDEDKEYHAMKHAMVAQILSEQPPQRLLDVGANRAAHAFAAAADGARVAVLDSDPAVCDALFLRARETSASVQVICADLAEPPGPSGWAHAEHPGLLDRLKDADFDVVLALAVVHHLTIVDGIGLDAVAELLASLTRDRLLVEHVPPDDRRAVALRRGRRSGPESPSLDTFVAAFARCMVVERVEPIGTSGRSLLVCRHR